MPSWYLLVPPTIVVVNLALLLTQSPWHEFWAMAQFTAALALTLLGVGRLLVRKGPTLMHLLLWLALASTLPIVMKRGELQRERLRSVGSEQLLRDARFLVAEVGPTDAEKSEHLEGENLLVPPSFRKMNPYSVRVTNGTVVLILSMGLGMMESLEISADPKIVPGGFQFDGPLRSWSEGDNHFDSQEIAPGISLKRWRS